MEQTYHREIADSLHDFHKTQRCDFDSVGNELLYKNNDNYYFLIEKNNVKEVINNFSPTINIEFEKFLNKIKNNKISDIEDYTMSLYNLIYPQILNETEVDISNYKVDDFGPLFLKNLLTEDEYNNQDGIHIAFINDCGFIHKYNKSFSYIDDNNLVEPDSNTKHRLYMLSTIASDWDEAPKGILKTFYVDIIPDQTKEIHIYGTNVGLTLSSLDDYEKKNENVNLVNLDINNLYCELTNDNNTISRIKFPHSFLKTNVFDLSVSNMCKTLKDRNFIEKNKNNYINYDKKNKLKINFLSYNKDILEQINTNFSKNRIDDNKLFYNLKRSMDAGQVEILNYLNKNKNKYSLIINNSNNNQGKPSLVINSLKSLNSIESLKKILKGLDFLSKNDDLNILKNVFVPIGDVYNSDAYIKNINKYVLFTCDRLCYLKAKIMNIPAVYTNRKTFKFYKGISLTSNEMANNIYNKYYTLYQNPLKEVELDYFNSRINNINLKFNINFYIDKILLNIRQKIDNIKSSFDNNNNDIEPLLKEAKNKFIQELSTNLILLENNIKNYLNDIIKYLNYLTDKNKFNGLYTNNNLNKFYESFTDKNTLKVLYNIFSNNSNIIKINNTNDDKYYNALSDFEKNNSVLQDNKIDNESNIDLVEKNNSVLQDNKIDNESNIDLVQENKIDKYKNIISNTIYGIVNLVKNKYTGIVNNMFPIFKKVKINENINLIQQNGGEKLNKIDTLKILENVNVLKYIKQYIDCIRTNVDDDFEFIIKLTDILDIDTYIVKNLDELVLNYTLSFVDIPDISTVLGEKNYYKSNEIWKRFELFMKMTRISIRYLDTYIKDAEICSRIINDQLIKQNNTLIKLIDTLKYKIENIENDYEKNNNNTNMEIENIPQIEGGGYFNSMNTNNDNIEKYSIKNINLTVPIYYAKNNSCKYILNEFNEFINFIANYIFIEKYDNIVDIINNTWNNIESEPDNIKLNNINYFSANYLTPQYYTYSNITSLYIKLYKNLHILNVSNKEILDIIKLYFNINNNINDYEDEQNLNTNYYQIEIEDIIKNNSNKNINLFIISVYIYILTHPKINKNKRILEDNSSDEENTFNIEYKKRRFNFEQNGGDFNDITQYEIDFIYDFVIYNNFIQAFFECKREENLQKGGDKNRNLPNFNKMKLVDYHSKYFKPYMKYYK